MSRKRKEPADVSSIIDGTEGNGEGEAEAASEDGRSRSWLADGSGPMRAAVADVADDLERRQELTGPVERGIEPDRELAIEIAAESDADGGDVEIEAGSAVMPTSGHIARALDPGQLKSLVEALVFASDKPVTLLRLRQLTRISDTKRLEQALAELANDYLDRGLILQQVSGGWQFRTRSEWATWVQQLIAGRPVRLTRAQLETLAIVAYRQPITRPEIDDIRGVDSSQTLKLLMERGLIRCLGKREEVGRPLLYGTTKEFLDFFSLGDLRELPTLREYSELTDESRRVIDDRLGPDDDDDGESGGGDGSAGGNGDPEIAGVAGRSPGGVAAEIAADGAGVVPEGVGLDDVDAWASVEARASVGVETSRVAPTEPSD